MYSRSRSRRVAALALTLFVPACGDEQRHYREQPPAGAPTADVRVSDLRVASGIDTTPTMLSYDNNSYALASGKKLYYQMNCAGCHSNGGGGIGPPLTDAEWIYGRDPLQIFNSIIEGRPNGMPSFQGKLGNQQSWQLVAYVRSLSGLGGGASGSAREDHMMLSPNMAIRSEEQIKRKPPAIP